MNEFELKLKLFSDHNLIYGNIGNKSIEDILKAISNTRPSNETSLGFFDAASPDFNTYFPEASEDDFIPKDEDFIYPAFRLLSKTIVNQWIPIDFSQGSVLKKSMDKFSGITIYPDHEKGTANNLGVVVDVWWQNAYTTSTGQRVPAGVNGRLKVDAKSNVKVARGLSMEPPSIHSGSVTIQIKSKKSHDDMDDWDFFEKAGSEIDGEIVRLIVTEILDVTEYSLVWAGADPYAKILDGDNKIKSRPLGLKKYHESVSNGLIQNKCPELICSANNMADVFTVSNRLSEFFNTEKNNHIKHPEKMNIESINKKLGLELTDESGLVTYIQSLMSGKSGSDAKVTQLQTQLAEKDASAIKLQAQLTESDAKIGSLTKELDSSKPKIESLTAEVAEKDAKVGELTTKLETLQSKVDDFTDQSYSDFQTKVTELRATTLGLYKSVEGDKADENIIELIQNSPYKQLISLHKNFDKSFEEKLPLMCSDCGSLHISRKVSKPGGDEALDNNLSNLTPSQQVAYWKNNRKQLLDDKGKK